jgi:hypothetical protein
MDCQEARSSENHHRGGQPHDHRHHADGALTGGQLSRASAVCGVSQWCAKREGELEDGDACESGGRNNGGGPAGATARGEEIHDGTSLLDLS